LGSDFVFGVIGFDVFDAFDKIEATRGSVM
jgi:hypothetical protein